MQIIIILLLVAIVWVLMLILGQLELIKDEVYKAYQMMWEERNKRNK